MGLYVKSMEGQELLSFLFGGGRKSYALFYKCIFRRDFLFRVPGLYAMPTYGQELHVVFPFRRRRKENYALFYYIPGMYFRT